MSEPMRPSRRGLLKGAGVLGLAGLVGAKLPTSLAYAAGYTGDVLVVLSMRGGQDSLSVVPPVGDANYATLRPTIGIPSSLALPLGGVFGLHPALAAIKPLYDGGKLAVVHALSQPNPTRSHFEAQAELEKAAPGSSLTTGWLDRVLGVRGGGTSFQAVQMGSSMLPDSLMGPAPSLAMTGVDDFELSVWSGYQTPFVNALSALYSGVAAPVAEQVTATLGALSTTAAMKTTGYTPANGATYPSSPLGDALQDTARLIKVGAGLQVATIDYGNWDMHVNLGRPGDVNGWMHGQLLDVGGCLAAFARDLGTGLNNVTLVTLTEFGRRAAENGSGGVDHGHGQASLVLGGGVKGGQVYGTWPGLAPAALDQGDLAGANDYRNLLGEILVKRCGMGSLSTVFPGLSYAPMGVVNTAA